MKMTFQEIRIIATGPCITNQLRDVNTICRRSWYIAAHIWKIYDFKIEIVPFIINFSTDLTTVVINNSRFAEFLPLIYPPELEVKETTDTASSASFLDLYLEFDDSGQISTKSYLYENPSFIIFSAETEYISKYKLFKRSNKANLVIALVQ
jgi:hypothetical protein